MPVYSKTFHCPDLMSQEDQIIVEETLQNSPGIERIKIDRALHTVSVVTANEDGMKDVELLLHQAGYPPNEEEE